MSAIQCAITERLKCYMYYVDAPKSKLKSNLINSCTHYFVV